MMAELLDKAVPYLVAFGVVCAWAFGKAFGTVKDAEGRESFSGKALDEALSGCVSALFLPCLVLALFFGGLFALVKLVKWMWNF